ncbi:MAG: hypothetical protein E6K76_08620 [Candidatus Eisenbacteria bacterium]|uniref:SnoaL-like domain-containing protein n=1 Tax=Eiseniibacteriota bacterium TaxID=2212470 RepID=A0A538T3C1_UNCEI|nr:MAG: hypothetical protein E6K76_08620 [Candidatus Eisenbacteria bacterium]
MDITAGDDVAFVAALMQCSGTQKGGKRIAQFRVTMGLCKIDGQWTVTHEHHSIPAG